MLNYDEMSNLHPYLVYCIIKAAVYQGSKKQVNSLGFGTEVEKPAQACVAMSQRRHLCNSRIQYNSAK